MRTDLETVVAECMADYLKSVVLPATQLTCPIVTFTDPMSIDDANRIVVMVPSCNESGEVRGNADCVVEIGIKTQWAQASISEDCIAHFARVNEVRNALAIENFAEVLQPFTELVGINFVQPARQQSTKIVDGFYYSETQLIMNTYTV